MAEHGMTPAVALTYENHRPKIAALDKRRRKTRT
jgi:hypothetical protein